MDCTKAMNFLDDYIDDSLEPKENEIFLNHISMCSNCSAQLDNAKNIQVALKNLQVPLMENEFPKRAIRNAVRKNKIKKISNSTWIRLAASLILIIGLTRLYQGPLDFNKGHQLEVSVSMNKPEKIQLVFNSKEDLKNVAFSLKIPESINLIGYKGQREIAWTGELVKGQNLLVLPIVANNMVSGLLTAEIRHGQNIKLFNLHISVKKPIDLT